MEKKPTILERYGRFSTKNPEIVLIITVILTVFFAVNALSIEVETDFFKSLPQDLPAIKNQNLLSDVFSESDSIFVLASLNNEKSTENEIKDIRDPRIMNDLYDLQTILEKDPKINSIVGAPLFLVNAFGGIPNNIDLIKSFFGDARNLFGDDYSLTTLIIRLEGKVEQKDILDVTGEIEEDIESVGFPGSIYLAVTGGPIIGKIIGDLIFEDLFSTVSLASLLILLTLVIAYRSPLKGIFSLTILAVAIIWTAGTMVILSIPLSIVTVVVGSLVIGIGIDYAIHMINRYNEELSKRYPNLHKISIKNCYHCYGIAVDRVGKAIIGTGVTTIASFMALTISGIPFLSDLGVVLSLGIFYAMMLTIFVFPSILSLGERIIPSIRRSVS